MVKNKLYHGNNLEVLKTLKDESIDLIYLDPPFFSKRKREAIWNGDVRTFDDGCAGGIDLYITWLRERVTEMYRVLKPTGSIYVHCDWHANSYIRVEVLDKIFGSTNFRNEIMWVRATNTGSFKAIAKKFPNNIDSIFYYTKSSKYCFNRITKGYKKEYLRKFNLEDDHGKYKWQPLKSCSEETYDKLDREGKIKNNTTSKYPQYKKYLHELQDGVPLSNLWNDIPPIGPMSKERVGYPTQKPEALLQRIIEVSSNEGDVVLDPCCGSGTTLVVADKLNRKWIGIDQSEQALEITRSRMKQIKK